MYDITDSSRFVSDRALTFLNAAKPVAYATIDAKPYIIVVFRQTERFGRMLARHLREMWIFPMDLYHFYISAAFTNALKPNGAC